MLQPVEFIHGRGLGRLARLVPPYLAVSTTMVVRVARGGGSWSTAVPVASSTDLMRFHSLTSSPSVFNSLAIGTDFIEEAMQFTPESLQAMADTMRECLLLLGGPCPETLRANMVAHIARLQAMRDASVRSGALRFKRAYAIEKLIESVIAGGLLENTGDLGDVIKHSIAIVTDKERQLRGYFLRKLSEDHTVPSKASLKRHRLTLHMALCVILQEQTHDVLHGAGGAVSWRTLDLSPQKGQEWLLAGASTMAQADLPKAMDASMGLYLRDGEQQRNQCELLSFLRLQQSVPVGVGPKSLKHKIHAVAHSQKLCAKSWKDCWHILNTSVSVVGDSGEATTVRFRGKLDEMFGAFVLEEDNPDGPDFDWDGNDPGIASDDRSPDFDFQAAPEEDGSPNFEFGDEPVHPDGGGVDPPVVPAPEPVEPNDYPPLEDYMVDLNRACFLIGPHHVLHNLTESLPSVLRFWVQFIEWLKQVCRLLSRRWMKRRLLETCFTHGPQHVFYSSVKTFNKLVYDKRWGTGFAAVHHLLPIMPGLKQGWRKERYLAGRRPQADADDGDERDENDKACDIDAVDLAIKSKLFWGYQIMVDLLATFFMYLS